ncbi:transmembrane protein 141 [Anopheles ziemanni]|uniref:transmembrane protein 141 n=1 Tax=Anopheles coustani TaxID=139045 RepID=UPI0026598DD4|nr:transmembrane protein 141 [Anopheles coustani]XP_058171643.1 transmembrane protein 141 [Anopheles ziemanni]
MNDIRLLKDQQREKHPGFDSYIECSTRSLFTGLATFSLGFAGVYFLQQVGQRYLPYTKKGNILVAAIVSTVASYKVTSDRMRACQARWMAVEDKYSVLQETLDTAAPEGVAPKEVLV